jgi:general stress protein 26
MAEKGSRTKDEIWGLLKKTQTVFLATLDGKQPRVRPVTMIHYDKKLWVTTGTKDAKVKQIKKNPKFEVSWLFGRKGNPGSLRFSGTAEIVKDIKTKTGIAGQLKWFNYFWKSVSDPNFTLLRLSSDRAEYMRPGEMKIHKVRL